MISLTKGTLALAVVLGAGVAPGQIPGGAKLVFEDDFGGTSLNSSLWQISGSGGSANVSGGVLTLRDGWNLQSKIKVPLGAGTVAIEYTGVAFTRGSTIPNGCSVGFNNWTPPLPTFTSRGSYGTTAVGPGYFLGYDQGALSGFVPSWTASPGTNTFVWLVNSSGFELYRNSTQLTAIPWPSGPIDGQHTLAYLETVGIGTVTVDRVRMYTTETESSPVSRPVAGSATSNLDFAPLPWTMSVVNSSPQSGAITVTLLNGAAPSFPTVIQVGNRYYQIDGMTGLTFNATLVYTFPTSELGDSGVQIENLRVFKKSGSDPWVSIPFTYAEVGADTTLTIPNVSGFSLFGLGDNSAAVAGWEMLEE